jgi:predicted lysophospholipase L1 biosynthesis ABC-type transport system permease subunit
MEAVAENEKEKKLETKKTGMQKFLSGFLKFLTMGGFLVILIAIVGIVILISYLTK